MIRRAIRQLGELKKNQYLSPEKLRDLQEERLKRVVEHAYRNVEYYRGLFDKAGLKPEDIRGLDDLQKIPVTTKEDIQGLAPEQLTARGYDLGKCVVKHTSGSTGHPLKIFFSPEERDFQILLNLRILMENGLGLGDRTVYIINPHRFPKSKYWFQQLGILRREYLSVFDFPRKHLDYLKRRRPEIIYGYPSNLTLLALAMREEGNAGIRPKAVFSVAEALEPKARETIDSVMGAPTCDILGTIELGDIAWECRERRGYHLSADAVIVEFLDDGKPAGPGEPGKTVCTSLYGFAMPFIRYEVGDICVPAGRPCACGRTLPMIESIKGRANDFIVLPSGRIVASCFLVITMQSIHEVDHYRVIQENKDSLTVQIVRGTGYDDNTRQRIKEEISSIVHGALYVNLDEMDSIPRDPSGKIRTVVSRIIPDYQEKIDETSGTFIKNSSGTEGGGRE